jgi:hypothetical protein
MNIEMRPIASIRPYDNNQTDDSHHQVASHGDLRERAEHTRGAIEPDLAPTTLPPPLRSGKGTGSRARVTRTAHRPCDRDFAP